MNVLKKGLLALAGGVAIFFLILTAIDAGVVRVVGSPDPIKRVLADSGIYKSIVPSVLEQAEKDASDEGSLPFGHPIVRSAAEATLNSRYLEATTSSVIDSVYRWLNKETPIPDFKIDLSDKKVEFANRVAAGVKKEAAELPRCTSAPRGDFDIFSAKCLPYGVTPAQVSAAIRNDILKSSDFLDDAVITADDVKSAGSSQSFFSGQLKDAPGAYEKFKSSPLALAVVALLALAAVVFLSGSRLAGLKHAGFIVVGTGLFLLLLALAMNEAMDNKVISQISLENSALQANLRQLASDLADRLSNSFLTFGGAYLAVGGLMIGGYFFLRRTTPQKPRPRPRA